MFCSFYHNTTICDNNQEYNRVMSDGSEDYRWKSVIHKIIKMESRIDPENRTTNLYDPHFCYSENEDNPHVIGGYVQNTFKFNCQSIIKRINQLDVHIQSRKTKGNTFFPLQKDFLPKGKKMMLKKIILYSP